MDIEAILAAEDDEALKELKLFLFKENIRLKNEQKELAEYKEKLLRERAQFRVEMDMLHHKAVLEQKRIKDDNLFFEKKMDILNILEYLLMEMRSFLKRFYLNILN